MTLDSQQNKEELKKEILKCFEIKENESILYQNEWQAGRAGLTGKFIDIKTFKKRLSNQQLDLPS